MAYKRPGLPNLVPGQPLGVATPQIPGSGISATITTAQLTLTGHQGSMTFANGVLVAQTPAT